MKISKTISEILIVSAHIIIGSNAFGAGKIATDSSLHAKAYRHGNLEDSLLEITKNRVRAFPNAKAVPPFTKKEVDIVYSANWLRDVSQVIDTTLLQKGASPDFLRTGIKLMHLIKFGNMMDLNERSIGCAKPVEHIDNPLKTESGHNLYSCLRGPVDPEEIEVNPKSGLKNYIATEGRSYENSLTLTKTLLVDMVNHGRNWLKSGSEIYHRKFLTTLGRMLHTLEDWYAHSNFLELMLRELGYDHVYPMVGEKTSIYIESLKRNVYPLVTGTFGSTDSLISLIGEFQDSIGESLEIKANHIKSKFSLTKSQQSSLAKETDSKIEGILGKCKEKIATGFKAVKKMFTSDEKETCPPPPKLWKGSVFKSLGLHSFVESWHQSLTDWQKDIISKDVEQNLKEDDANPTHSRLAKDHFTHPLNQLAGECAIIMLNLLVPAILDAVEDPSPKGLQSEYKALAILTSVFVHPAFSQVSDVNRALLPVIKNWAMENENNINRISKDRIVSQTHLSSINSMPRRGSDFKSLLAPTKEQ